MTHTKGPWVISGVRVRFGGEPVLQIMDGNGEPFQYVFYGDGSTEQHRAAYADAHLIAAAPDMLALLKRLQYWFDTDETLPSPADQKKNAQWVEEITAVITKAKAKNK